MRQRHPPFILVNGRTYLNVAFSLAPTDHITLHQLADQLLRHAAQRDVLLLRALSPGEQEIVDSTVESATHEAWAQVCARDQDRYRSRK